MGTSLIVASLWVRQVGCDLQLLVIWVSVLSMSLSKLMDEPTEYSLGKWPMTLN